MSEMPPTFTGLSKAASLLLSLGVERSSQVLQLLAEGDLERVMLAISSIGHVPVDVRVGVLREAYELSLAGSTIVSGGVDYTRQLLARTVGSRRGAEIMERISASKQLPSFDILRKTDPAQLAGLLQDEHPQTIALVLSYLDAKFAADILTNMPSQLQVDITLRLANMDRVSSNVAEVVERGLRHKFSSLINVAGFKETGGVSFLVKMLNQVDRDVQKRIFESLNSMNPALSDEIRANMFTFDDIVKLDDRSVQRVIRDINKQDLSLALKGAPDKMREVFFRNLSERARENLKDEIDILGPQLAKNVYAAQRRIVDIVRSLEEKEEIIIAGGGEEYAIIA